MPRGVAVNVGANTNIPGVRGPIYPDGRFRYVPIPEREPTAESVPTYADLDLDVDLPAEALDERVHLDPTFAEYPCCDRYTYGDDYAAKAGPLSELSAGDYVFFYATLSTAVEIDGDADGPVPDAPADWIAPEWGAYVIGQFRLARDPLTGDEYRVLDPDERAWFDANAHVRRETFDARVLLAGDPEESALYDRAIPLSERDAGSDANRLVTELSSDSGRGPWWRRPMRFDADGVEELLAIRENRAVERCFAAP
ncbi:hypothetical protein ACFQDG_05815 [Natronoarchaeum mannanilyticum]|uniref:Nucleotide modification associated domain-containing protein n=1 Tax=Natronoarchaeum mannanilyticum TaxID=926360 RepID=A0AAV3T9W6_9EURY